MIAIISSMVHFTHIHVTATHACTHTHTPPHYTLSRMYTNAHTQHVQKLLKNNPDPDAVDDNGDTPLHAYVKRKDKHKFDCLVTFLIHSKCDLDKPNANDMTALHLAAEVSK